MRIRNIKISNWRHFENIELSLGDDIGLVCVVGANGTGKSHLLELIAACAHRLGLSQGVSIPRGDPFTDPHNFSLQFYIAEGSSAALDTAVAQHRCLAQWDRTLKIESERSATVNAAKITAGGITVLADSVDFAGVVIAALQRSQDVHFVSLDADRAYPKKNYNVNQVAEAYEIDWAGTEFTRGRSYQTTAMLYDEWIKYLLAQENQSGTRLITDTRRARRAGDADPVFSDHFEAYRESLQKVLPHVVFVGVNSKKRTILFDTTGLELTFDQLSGGEREIAFLVGQVDRFGLRKGLFLLDEPELHLNADLIRKWVAYLTSTVETGQIWLATHSLEAVEAAGQEATFVLERHDERRIVNNAARLDTRPVLAALSRAVGTPAFSISQLSFAYVEGEEGVGERERFRRLSGTEGIRFMECGSCNEVIKRIGAIKALAEEAETEIRIGGIVDRDFLSEAEAAGLAQTGVFVLPVHEVENFFLHPDTIQTMLTAHGVTDRTPAAIICAASDARAGAWVFQSAMATTQGKSLPALQSASKEIAKVLTWADMETDQAAALQRIVDVSGFGTDDKAKFTRILTACSSIYQRKRGEADLWKICEGKQVLSDVARTAGFSGVSAMMQAAFAAWERGETLSIELQALRTYLQGL